MNKLEFVAKQLDKTKKKRYEQLVVHRIWNTLNDLRVKFVTQQFVKRPESVFVIGALIFLCLSGSLVAQSTNKTVVLVRHVEKAASTPTDKGDPELSSEGRERAVRLMHAIKKYKPHEIYSTDYKRTRQTAEPIANRRKKQIQIYDPAKSAELIEKIMASKTDHYLIVGHSNTIPALANLLIKKEVFRQMPETEFGVIWVIRMKKSIVTKIEVFTY